MKDRLGHIMQPGLAFARLPNPVQASRQTVAFLLALFLGVAFHEFHNDENLVRLLVVAGPHEHTHVGVVSLLHDLQLVEQHVELSATQLQIRHFDGGLHASAGANVHLPKLALANDLLQMNLVPVNAAGTGERLVVPLLLWVQHHILGWLRTGLRDVLLGGCCLGPAGRTCGRRRCVGPHQGVGRHRARLAAAALFCVPKGFQEEELELCNVQGTIFIFVTAVYNSGGIVFIVWGFKRFAQVL
mmetsp:Transcript_17744/g.49937  ORF Transcript_17744/g.49937 Transcript_17744/m.49937 type:complete len:243 (-) Transcript_17744:227-955(-)